MNVVIYTKENCNYCTSAKTFLKSKGISYQERALGLDFTRETLLEMFPSATTFPVVVVDGFNIGGFQELTKMINEQTQNTGRYLTEGEWNGA